LRPETSRLLKVLLAGALQLQQRKFFDREVL